MTDQAPPLQCPHCEDESFTVDTAAGYCESCDKRLAVGDRTAELLDRNHAEAKGEIIRLWRTMLSLAVKEAVESDVFQAAYEDLSGDREITEDVFEAIESGASLTPKLGVEETLAILAGLDATARRAALEAHGNEETAESSS